MNNNSAVYDIIIIVYSSVLVPWPRISYFIINIFPTSLGDAWTPTTEATPGVDISYPVRLVSPWGNMDYPLSGRVEVQVNDTWGTICGDNWGVEDAMVVCYQLDLPFTL